jgi:alkylation response protein AidB-like acyl-CoA dehydrogenase
MVTISPEEQMLLDVVKKIAKEKVAPRAAEIDSRDEFPWDLVEIFSQQGLLQIMIPEKYGGGGVKRVTTVALIAEELAKASLAVASIFVSAAVPITLALLRNGNQTQQDTYFPKLVSGRKLTGIALTEPNAGSDAAGIQTKAIKQGKNYILEGQKCFCSMGSVAEIFSIFAKTDENKGTKGITAFLVEKGAPGFRIGKIENKMGVRGLPVAELIFDELVVPEENRLGEEGEGFKIVMNIFDTARVLVGVKAIGLAQGAFQYALAYAKERIQFGQPIAHFQAIQFMLADMATQIEAARGLIYNAATLIDQGKEDISHFSSMAKYYASDTAMKVTTDAVQILGGYGYMKDHPVERMMRDAKLTQIWDGTNQIQRIIVARRLLKD